jgi:hypothetical protein
MFQLSLSYRGLMICIMCRLQFDWLHCLTFPQIMLSHILCVLLFYTLLHTASLTGWNPDLRGHRSRSYLSEAKVKSIQDILLLQDSYSPTTPHIPQSNVPSHGYRSHQKHNPLNGPQYTVSDSSGYRPYQKNGYEIYEEPDDPGSNVEQTASQQPNSGHLGLPSSTLSTRKANLQVHQIYRGKPTELLEDAVGVPEPGGVSSYQRPQAHLNNKDIKPPAPRVTLMYQTAPTQFQGNVGILPNFHGSYGQYPETLSGLTGLRLAQGVNPLTALLLASSLGIPVPIIAAWPTSKDHPVFGMWHRVTWSRSTGVSEELAFSIFSADEVSSFTLKKKTACFSEKLVLI